MKIPVPAQVAVGAAVTAAAVVAVRVRDPYVPGSWPPCPVFAATGLLCPGCGSMRALHDVSSGDVVSAFSANVLVFAAAVAFVVSVLVWVRRRGTHPGVPLWRVGPVGGVGAAPVWLVVVVVFTVVRNLPFGAAFVPA